MGEAILNALEKIYQVILVSLLWVIGCIPVVTVGTSTAAMYYTVVKTIRRETGYPVREFIKAYKMNLKQGIPATLILEAVTFLMYFNINYAIQVVKPNDNTMGSVLEVAYIACMILLLAFGIYLFPVLSRLQVGFKELMRITALLAARHLVTTVVLLLIAAVVVAGCYVFLPGLIILPALGCLVASFMLERILKRITLSGNEEVADENQWYNQ